ncbi:DUF6265 family protein [Dyadobacter subterraneus]|uniref:DUF6265 domain-containing protein n=1 Tax=Dyadobacter subterraneus TaxID=2773304 RepID=A0ABR9W873_9BACT|nr:DUF6265 family protein [Dyadobacter subterraneus]MBE9461642.1 hypothetical protein [Dyadobacter subterraneus]
MRLIISLLFVFVFFQFSNAQSTSKTGSLADLAFTEGKWIANVQDRTIEATWLPAKGDNIVGFFRMTNGGKPTIFELLVYEQTEQGPVSLVKHFASGLIGQEEIDKPVKHKWIESGTGRVVFEKEGDPVRVLYEKRSADNFVISLGKPQDGKWIYTSLFDFKRVK